MSIQTHLSSHTHIPMHLSLSLQPERNSITIRERIAGIRDRIAGAAADLAGDAVVQRTWLSPLQRLSKASLTLGLLCLLDLASTVWLLKTQGAVEANPLMNRFLEHGIGPFILAKLGFSVLPLILLEWARRRCPHFVRGASKIAVIAYLLCYCVGVVRENTVVQQLELPPDARFLTQEYLSRPTPAHKLPAQFQLTVESKNLVPAQTPDDNIVRR